MERSPEPEVMKEKILLPSTLGSDVDEQDSYCAKHDPTVENISPMLSDRPRLGIDRPLPNISSPSSELKVMLLDNKNI